MIGLSFFLTCLSVCLHYLCSSRSTGTPSDYEVFLTISLLSIEDAGTYTLLAKSSGSISDQQDIQLVVNGTAVYLAFSLVILVCIDGYNLYVIVCTDECITVIISFNDLKPAVLNHSLESDTHV